MRIEELQPQGKAEWDAYVETCADATFYHLAGWQDVMRDTLGMRPHYLLARDNGRICGVLPLLHVRSPLLGSHITSMPGALCAADDSAAYALLERAGDLLHATASRYLILRDGRRRLQYPGLTSDERQCTFLVDLAPDADSVWRRLDSRARGTIRRADASNLVTEIRPGEMQGLYAEYRRAMRDKGTPTQGRAFFSRALQEFGNRFASAVVRRDGRAIGGGFIAFLGPTIYQTWAALLPEFYPLGSSFTLYWAVIRYGCSQGYRCVDLGRSARESGGYTFKMHWRPQVRTLYQQVLLNGNGRPPAVGRDWGASPRYRLFLWAWQRLPLEIAEWAGPRLRRSVPFG